MATIEGLTKAQAKAILGLKNDSQLAKEFKITRAAVSLWPEHGAMPKERELELKFVLRPEIFEPREASRPKAEPKPEVAA